jgi:hypothetical protein
MTDTIITAANQFDRRRLNLELAIRCFGLQDRQKGLYAEFPDRAAFRTDDETWSMRPVRIGTRNEGILRLNTMDQSEL